MDMEFNKIFAAVLTAGIIATTAGFLSAHVLYHPKFPEKSGYEIAASEDDGSGATQAAATGPEPIDVASADIAKGEKLAKVCAACHTFDKGGANKVGPNLHGVVGSKHAYNGGFNYSEAMKTQGGKWDYEALNKFLWKPNKAIPGTKMTFAGLKKPEDRAALIKWLESQK